MIYYYKQRLATGTQRALTLQYMPYGMATCVFAPRGHGHHMGLHTIRTYAAEMSGYAIAEISVSRGVALPTGCEYGVTHRVTGRPIGTIYINEVTK